MQGTEEDRGQPMIANVESKILYQLQAWLQDMATYVKSIDSNHLLCGGGSGSFGATTPQFFNVRAH